jgi:hypothetical protein
MKHSHLEAVGLARVVAALALAAMFSLGALGQTPQAPPQGGPPGGGRGGGRGGFGPQLPPEQRAEVNRINAALQSEADAVTKANAALIGATFSLPVDKDKIARANDELAKAREAWATKAAKLFADTQASDKKLSADAIAVLVQSASGRGGFGFGRRGGGFEPGERGRRGSRRGADGPGATGRGGEGGR